MTSVGLSSAPPVSAVRVRRWLLRPLLWAYKLVLSPFLFLMGARCRFTPTCSEYAYEAVCRHGFARGGLMSAARILRCRPGYPSAPGEVDWP
jgi:putative membrane protein insertion efficiency factor